ncbi:MAG: amino acid adenylation domain-containing protein, partial [bacterium]|nr:amino acid adenylation domain-containing protein [bacterium]
SFRVIENEPVQVIQRTAEVDIRDITLPEEEFEDQAIGEIYREFVQPFDLSRAPLLHLTLVSTTNEEKGFYFLYDIHHIIFDGHSSRVLIDDFTRLYDGVELPPMKIQYKDFSCWQNNLFKTGKIEKQEAYWREIFSGGIPKLELPLDYPRPPVFTFKGETHTFELDEEESAQFKQLAAENDATMFMSVLAVFNVLLFKYTGQEDVVTGCSIAGRPHADMDYIIGMFVNELALRTRPAAEKYFIDFFLEAKEISLKAFENQDVQFEELVENINIDRNPSRNPLFDVCLSVQTFEKSKRKAEGLTVSARQYHRKIAKFDLTLFAYEVGDKIRFSLEYYSEIFNKSTIQQFSNHLLEVVKQVTRAPYTHLADIDILSQEEKEHLLQSFNQLRTGYPEDKTIHRLFEEQVEKTPNAVAVTTAELYKTQTPETITYTQLEEKSNQMANYLYQAKNVHPGQPVGILMEKSIDTVTAILGILKAGGTYVPLDPDYPEERIKHIINDAIIQLVISQKKQIKRLNRIQWECPSVDTYLCMDSTSVQDEEEIEKSGLMDEKIWTHVGETAMDDITGGGWQSSYTGEPIPKEEMDEYSENILKKLTPLLNKKMRVLEIGCATGLSMYRLAPQVGLYYGTDLSEVIIERNREQIKREEHENIKLACLAAHELYKIDENDFDLVILNSVIQHFHGHNYLVKMIKEAVKIMNDEGFMFIGDVMDQDLKEDLIKEMKDFKQANAAENVRTKTDWFEELFISKTFFRDLEKEIPGIMKVEFTEKIRTIENELTKFRYDALIKVDKKRWQNRHPEKSKHQEDKRELEKFGSERVDTQVKPHHTAYIIYTSGTTGKPKGSLIEHRNVVRLMVNDNNLFDFDSNDVWTMFHSYCFDFSVWEMYGALLFGGKLVVIPKNVARDTHRYLELLEEEKVTVLNQTPAAFYNLAGLEMTAPSKKHYLRYIIFGGDALRPVKLKHWKEKYPGTKLINMFGITETTVHVTYKEIDQKDIDLNVSNIGKPIPTLITYVVDKRGKPVPVGVAGEMVVGGEGVCRGYLNRPELTHEKFVASPFRPGERLYRTGDRVRLTDNGNMEYLGRIDNQVKVRGFRIEPGEIENRLLKNDKIKETVVIARDYSEGETTGDDARFLCAYLVSEKDGAPSTSQLRAYLAQDLPDYMIPAYFIYIEKIPLTPNGKVDRKALPGWEMETEGEYIAPRNETEQKLADIWKRALKLEQVGINDNYFNVGGDSIRAIKVLSLINNELNTNLKIIDLFTNDTIEKLAERIKLEKRGSTDEEIKEAVTEIEKLKNNIMTTIKVPLPEEIEDIYSMSDIEKGMVFHSLKDPELAIYHHQMAHQMKYIDFEPDRFKKALALMVKKHPILRTCFNVGDFEEAVQIVYKNGKSDIAHFDISHLSTEKQEEYISKYLEEDRQNPFNTTEPPLWRMRTFTLDKENILFLWLFHHAILDGWSDASFKTELNNIYLALKTEPQLAPGKLESTYKEFIVEQIAMKKKKEISDFWKKELDGYKRLEFPAAVEEECIMTEYSANLDLTLLERLKDVAAKNNTSLKHLCFAAYIYMLGILSYDCDITAGLITNNRPICKDGENILGCFLNTVPVRIKIPTGIKWTEYIAIVDKKLLQLTRYGRMSLFEIVRITGEAVREQNPLVDTIFNFIDFHVYEEAKSENIPQNKETTKTKRKISASGKGNINTAFNFNIICTFGGFVQIITYTKPAVSDELVLNLSTYYERILNKFISEPLAIASREQLLPEKEKKQILYDFNNTGSEYPRDKTIHELFEEQVEKT